MNLQEHLLTILGEEGSEIAKDCSKSNRFGIDDIYTHIDPETGAQTVQKEKGTNRDRLIGELNDLLGVCQLLVQVGVLPSDWQDPMAQQNKKEKVRRYLRYSKQVGALKGKIP